MIVSIIGLGLIGGSMALDMKRRHFCDQVWGVDNNPLHAELALENNLVDRIMTLDAAIADSNLIVISIPVDATLGVLQYVLDRIKPWQTVMDLGSTKSEIVRHVANHPNRKYYIPAHPMAGTEFSGPLAAVANLYDGKITILCNTELAAKNSLDLAKRVFTFLNSRLVFMDAVEHDVHAAYISHISHITSFSLALTVIDKEKDIESIFNLAGGGFASTVRLANSSAAMWAPIFLQNKENLLTVLNTYVEKMLDFKKAIESDDKEGLISLMKEANQVHDFLRTRNLNSSLWKLN